MTRGPGHTLDSAQGAWAGWPGPGAPPLQLLDALGHAGAAPGHDLLLRLLVAVQEVRRGRGQELHAAPGRGLALTGAPVTLLADHRGRPPGGRGGLSCRHLATAPPQQRAASINT